MKSIYKHALMLSLSVNIFSCTDAPSGNDSTPSDTTSNDIVTVANLADLPTCDSAGSSRVVFVSNLQKFYWCNGSDWSQVRLENGVDGDKGDKGDAGVNGSKGDNGSQGLPGSGLSAISRRICEKDLSSISAPPKTPKTVGRHTIVEGQLDSAVVDGSFLYVADYNSGIRVINIADPSRSFEVTSFANPGTGQVTSIFKKGNFLYAVFGGYGFYIFDVSSPDQLKVVGIRKGLLWTGGYAQHLTVDQTKDWAYVSSDSGFHIIDVSNIASPQWVNSLYTSAPVYQHVVVGNYAYLVGGDINKDLIVASLAGVTTSNAPTLVGNGYTNEVGFPPSMAVERGNLLYLTYYDQVQILSLQTPSSPSSVGSIAASSGGYSDNSLAFYGSYAFVSLGGEGLRVYDVSNPLAPTDMSLSYQLQRDFMQVVFNADGQAMVYDDLGDITMLNFGMRPLESTVKVRSEIVSFSSGDVIYTASVVGKASQASAARVVTATSSDISEPSLSMVLDLVGDDDGGAWTIKLRRSDFRLSVSYTDQGLPNGTESWTVTGSCTL